MDTLHDLTEPIRATLLANQSVTALVQERIFSPAFSHTNEGTNDEYVDEPDPKLMFQQAGGTFDYRYLFISQAKTAKEAKQVAIAAFNALHKGKLSITAGSPAKTVIMHCAPEGGLVDSRNEVTKEPQVFFYMVFESL